MPAKRIPIHSGGPTAGTEGPVFVCTTCGKKTFKPGHLCAPATEGGNWTCHYCGALTDDPQHVCGPRQADQTEISYVCQTCGRVSTLEAALCKPEEVTG